MIEVTIDELKNILQDKLYITNNKEIEGVTEDEDSINIYEVKVINSEDEESELIFPASLLEADLTGLDISELTSAKNMFKDCVELTSLNISNWNTQNITDMTSMFENCEKLNSLDLSNFNTSKVADSESMFNATLKEVKISNKWTLSIPESIKKLKKHTKIYYKDILIKEVEY